MGVSVIVSKVRELRTHECVDAIAQKFVSPGV